MTWSITVTNNDQASVRSVWTPKEEALLIELTERKNRIMTDNRAAVSVLVSRCDEIPGILLCDQITDYLIANAEAMIDALRPFDTRS